MTQKQEPDRHRWISRFTGSGMTRQPPVQPAPSPRPYERPPSRTHRASMTVWQDKAVIKELKRLALEKETTQTALVAEALNLLFEKHGRPAVAT